MEKATGATTKVVRKGGAVRCNREALPAASVGPLQTPDAVILVMPALFGRGRSVGLVL